MIHKGWSASISSQFSEGACEAVWCSQNRAWQIFYLSLPLLLSCLLSSDHSVLVSRSSWMGRFLSSASSNLFPSLEQLPAVLIVLDMYMKACTRPMPSEEAFESDQTVLAFCYPLYQVSQSRSYSSYKRALRYPVLTPCYSTTTARRNRRCTSCFRCLVTRSAGALWWHDKRGRGAFQGGPLAPPWMPGDRGRDVLLQLAPHSIGGNGRCSCSTSSAKRLMCRRSAVGALEIQCLNQRRRV